MTVDDLVAKGAVRDEQARKVLGTGEIDVKVNVTVNKFSGSAKEKVEQPARPRPSDRSRTL